uniref:Transmembrane protein n=1 Tax=Schistocephalus solidus TaxID=70667 RepID=A0A0V0J4K2_SCHSO
MFTDHPRGYDRDINLWTQSRALVGSSTAIKSRGRKRVPTRIRKIGMTENCVFESQACKSGLGRDWLSTDNNTKMAIPVSLVFGILLPFNSIFFITSQTWHL